MPAPPPPHNLKKNVFNRFLLLWNDIVCFVVLTIVCTGMFSIISDKSNMDRFIGIFMFRKQVSASALLTSDNNFKPVWNQFSILQEIIKIFHGFILLINEIFTKVRGWIGVTIDKIFVLVHFMFQGIWISLVQNQQCWWKG